MHQGAPSAARAPFEAWHRPATSRVGLWLAFFVVVRSSMSSALRGFRRWQRWSWPIASPSWSARPSRRWVMHWCGCRCWAGSGCALQIMAERIDGAGMTVDDCASDQSGRLGRARRRGSDRRLLHARGQLSGHRPAAGARSGDYDRFAGFEARMELARPIDGRRASTAGCSGPDGETVQAGDREARGRRLPFADIARGQAGADRRFAGRSALRERTARRTRHDTEIVVTR